MADEVAQLSRQVSILCDGWNERIEYTVLVNDEAELRVERVRHAPLLLQLRTMTQPLVKAKQEGGSGAKAGTRPPGAFEAAALLDELGRYVADVRSQWRPGGLTLRSTVARTLYVLCESSGVQPAANVRQLSSDLGRYVRRARVIVGHDVPTRAFADSYCWQCGGQLRVPIDAAGAVFCAGTALSGPCGVKYAPEDVIRLAVASMAENEAPDAQEAS